MKKTRRDILLHFVWVVDDAKCIVVTRVCLSVCPRLYAHTTTRTQTHIIAWTVRLDQFPDSCVANSNAVRWSPIYMEVAQLLEEEKNLETTEHSKLMVSSLTGGALWRIQIHLVLSCPLANEKNKARYFVTFCVSPRRRRMYCGHARLSVCPRLYAHTTARTRM